MSLSQLSRINGSAPTGEGLGGLAEISREEIMGALGSRDHKGRKLDERALWVAQVFFGLGGATATAGVIQAIAEEFSKECERNKWTRQKMTKEEKHYWALRVGASVCLLHFGGYHCRVCEGRGHNKEYKTCGICNGTGHGQPTDADRAQGLGLDVKTYKNTWKARIEPLQGLIQTWEGVADRHIRYNLREVA